MAQPCVLEIVFFGEKRPNCGKDHRVVGFTYLV